ncbi:MULTISPECIES: tail fiber assembly protein [Enterobacteriaceae]|uniref:tail fiber assembly protein n=1 Tax=Enterobacteriaceae TaxID=543 RepID=UPI001EE4CF06|nr:MULTISPECIES: tail fiber assembly protein [Enterobacteriaceae]MDK1929354.1 tail fiber assembly protein [Klebsiella sp. K4-50]
MKYFSKITNGFYSEEINGEAMPSDVVQISDKQWIDLLEGQILGKVISADHTGNPVLTNPPPLSQPELAEVAEQQRNILRTEADAEIAWRQDAVDAGIATDKEASELSEWKKYRVLLMRVDTTKAPYINWPVKPE